MLVCVLQLQSKTVILTVTCLVIIQYHSVSKEICKSSDSCLLKCCLDHAMISWGCSTSTYCHLFHPLQGNIRKYFSLQIYFLKTRPLGEQMTEVPYVQHIKGVSYSVDLCFVGGAASRKAPVMHFLTLSELVLLECNIYKMESQKHFFFFFF